MDKVIVDQGRSSVYWKDGVNTTRIRTLFKKFVGQKFHVETFSLVLFVLV